MTAHLKDFYQGKTVLVTGHTGFKGGWLAVWLKLLGARVIGFALPPDTEPNFFSVAGIAGDMASIMGDVQQLPALSALFRQHSPDVVIHNAAQAIVRRAYREPVQTYATNVMGTVHVLEAARHTPSVRSVVVVTSDKCYEERKSPDGYREEDAIGGSEPYSSSKAAAELIVSAYRRSYFNSDGVAVASARAGNVIGGGDWSEDRLLPDIVRGIWSDRPVVIRRPNSVRPWQHVLEPVGGYLVLAERLWKEGTKYAEAWNFGPAEDDAIPVFEVARQVVLAWGKGELRIEDDAAGPHEAVHLRLNCEKSGARLGWRPKLSLKQAIERTVDWYRGFYEKSSAPSAITERQIHEYMRVADL